MFRNIRNGFVCVLAAISMLYGQFYNMDFQELTEELTINVSLAGDNFTIPVGTLHFESPDIDTSIYGFCSQAHVMVGDQLAELKYIMDYDQYNQEQLRKAGYIIQNFFPEVYNQPEGQETRDAYAAAVQAVIWEILEETDGIYNIYAGVIQYDGGTNFPDTSQAWLNFESYTQNMLASLAQMSPTFMPDSDIKAFQMDGTQDFMTITTLPEPATVALLGLGALAIRKKSKKDRSYTGS